MPAINNWQKKVKKNKNVMPKSGCNIIKPDIAKKEITKVNKYNFRPLTIWTMNQALNMK